MTVMADGFDAALVGFGHQESEVVAIYDFWMCVEILKAQGMDTQDAVDYMDFNVLGAHIQAPMPVFLDRDMTRADVVESMQ